MKFFNILTTFLPWIGYGILSSFSPGFAFIFAIVTSLTSYSKLKKGFILEWGSLLFFIAGFINLTLFKNMWFTDHKSLLFSLFFIAVVIFSLMINKPFTLQYAKLKIDKRYWDNPLFLRVNQIMTCVLGLIFLAVFMINLYKTSHPGIINGYLVWAIVLPIKIIFINRFPEWYKKRQLNKKF